MVEVSNNFIQECEANVGTYKFGKIKVNYIDDNPFNYEQGAYSSSNGAKIDAEQSIRYNKLVECEPNFKYKIELGNSAYKMKIVTYNANQAFIAAHDNLAEGSELTTESTAAYISVTIYSNDTLEGTSITLNNTIRNSEISGAELKGNTTQNGTPTPSSPVPVNVVTGEQVVRVCGKNLFDGQLELGGYGSTGAKVEANANYRNANTILVEPSTTYTFSINGASQKYVILFYDINGNFISQNTSLTTGTFTTLNNAYFINFRTFNADFVSDFFNLKVQLEKGSSATTYELYQGKDYEINLGKNLYEGSQYFSGDWKNADKWTTANETYNGLVVKYRQGTWNGLVKEIEIEKGGTYTFSFYAKKDTNGTINAYTGGGVGAVPDNATFNATTEWQRFSFTFTSSTGGKVRARVENPTNNTTIYICGYQLEKNNTMTSYAPYFTPIELNKIGNYQDYIRKGTGKNLYGEAIKTADMETAINTIILDSSEKLEIQGVSQYYSGIYKKYTLKPNTQYTISTFYSDLSNGAKGIIYYKFGDDCEQVATNNRDGYKEIGTARTSLTIETDSTGLVAILFCCNWTVNNGHIVYNNIQIEENSSVTYYEPYGYKDKWYIEKNVLKLVVPNAVTGTLQNNNKRFYVNGTNLGSNNILRNTSSSQTYGLYCDILGEVTASQTWDGTQGISYDYNSSIGLGCMDFAINGLTTIAEYQNALKGKAIYAIANTPKYTLIENEELIEQLNAVSHAETQEGTTNITSSGILPAILEVTPNLIESIRGKQTTPIVGYNITGDDDLINFKITSKADSNGNILGATSQSQVDIEIFNENNTHNLENKQVYISTGLNETEGNYCKWQPFTITQTKDTQTKNHTTYTGYDDMMRGNEAYIDNVDYGEEGVTLYDFTCKLAKEMGMALGNTTMTNGEFMVKGNNFTNNEAKLVVLKNVAQMAGGFAMIDRDNLLRIVELSPEDAMTPIELTTNLYTEDFQNSAKFGEINEFAIGETNIETNAIVRSDDASIAKNGVKKIEILDNMFLGLLEDKETAIEPLWDAFNGFSYYPFKTPYNGYPYIDLGDKINITDINSNVYGTLVLNNVFEYNGGYKGNIGAEALSITAAKYKTTNTLSKQFRKVGIDIDRVEGEITAEIAAREDTTEQVSQLSQTVNEINSTVSTTTTTVSDLETRVQTNETSISQNSDSITATISRIQQTEDDVETLETNTEDVIKQLVFGDDGLTISAKGTTSDDMKLNLTNDAIKFLYQNNAVLTINGSTIEFSNASFKKLDLGNYVWQAEDDDSLSLIYEGD